MVRRFPGRFRVTRLPFLVGTVALSWLEVYFARKFSASLSTNQLVFGLPESVLWFLLMLFQILAFFYFLVLPRLRDIGMNQAWALLMMIPGVNVFLWLILLFRRPTMNSGDAFDD